jgi:hypothetical protein
MLAVILGAMVVDYAFVLFGRYSQATVAAADKAAVDIRLARIFEWLFVEGIFDLLHLVKQRARYNGRIAVRILFAVYDHDAVKERVVQNFA